MCPWALFCLWWQSWRTAVESFLAGPSVVSLSEIVINWMMLKPSTEEGTGLGVIHAIPSTKKLGSSEGWFHFGDDGSVSGALLRAVAAFCSPRGRWEITCGWLLLMQPYMSLHLWRASGLAPAPRQWLFSIPVFSIRNLELRWMWDRLIVTEELPGRADLVQQLVLPNLTAVAAALGREGGGRSELCWGQNCHKGPACESQAERWGVEFLKGKAGADQIFLWLPVGMGTLLGSILGQIQMVEIYYFAIFLVLFCSYLCW